MPFPDYVAIKTIEKERCLHDHSAYQNIVNEFQYLVEITETKRPFLTPLLSAFQDKDRCYATMVCTTTFVYARHLRNKFSICMGKT